MTVKECYNAVSANYDEMLKRLGNEERVARFSKRFFETGDYENLEKSIENKDASAAFEFAHKIKGNALNIGFEHFSLTVSPLVEYLRPRVIEDDIGLEQLFETVKMEYFELKNVFFHLV